MAKQQPSEMPFLDHLEELRWRIIYSLIALTIGVGIGFWVMFKLPVIEILERPILPSLNGHHLVYTHPGDPFAIVLNASLGFGVLLALPVIVYQAWAFVSPALYRNEKMLVMPILLAATLLFLSGVALCYFIVLPLAIPWLMGFQAGGLEPMITANEYFSFATSMALAFGVAFELPIVILGLAGLGLVTPGFLRKYRKHAVVICLVVGAFLTPGDLIWTTAAMTVPLYLLYEVSIILSQFVESRRKRRLAALQAEAEAEAPGSEAPA